MSLGSKGVIECDEQPKDQYCVDIKDGVTRVLCIILYYGVVRMCGFTVGALAHWCSGSTCGKEVKVTS